MARYNNGFMAKLLLFFFFFTFATIIPVLLASRDIPAPSPYEEDYEVYIMKGFGEPAESPENDDDDDYELAEQSNDFEPSSAPGHAPAPAPEVSNMELPPEPEPGFYRNIAYCVKVIPEECGQPIVDAIYKNNPVVGFCCQKLVEMGKDCHFKLLKAISLVEQNAPHAEEISQRGSQLWSHCVSLV